MIIKWKWGGQSEKSDKQRLNAYWRQFIISLFTSNASPSGEHIHPCEGEAMTTSTKAPALPETSGTSRAPVTRKFTVEEYYRMAEVGILQPDERLELIDGEIIIMAPIGNPHATGVRRIERVFGRVLGDAVTISGQNPVLVGEHSTPQPDVAILRFREDDYSGKPPSAEDVLLLVEISDTTLAYDREVKVNLYAEANIPETWIMNLVEDCIESFTGPGPGGYSTHTIYRRGDRFSSSMLPDVEFAVDDLLPPAPAEENNEEQSVSPAQE
ncbi:MAG: Uma2 family endonuclease [Chloroflexi bacterium]|nr:Uma2 family endonuclease [Chloroflexota bacterium]